MQLKRIETQWLAVLIEEVERTTTTDDVDVNGGDKDKITSTQINHSLGNDQLDEEIKALRAEIKEQEAKLEALRKKLEPLRDGATCTTYLQRV